MRGAVVLQEAATRSPWNWAVTGVIPDGWETLFVRWGDAYLAAAEAADTYGVPLIDKTWDGDT